MQSIGFGAGFVFAFAHCAVPNRWKWGPEMGKSIISLLLFAAVWLPGSVAADEVKLAENAPDRYVVVKGDTLWGISAKFLKDPWRWPDVWGLNKDEIKNPHWIYPGDVVVLDFTGKTPRLRKDGGAAGVSDAASGDWQLMTTKLSPTIRRTALAAGAISSIPLSAISPFLTRPLVVGDKELNSGPQIVAGPESRVVLSAGDTALARGIVWENGNRWSVYRAGRNLVDPDTKEILGKEAIHLGDAELVEFGEISTLHITKSNQEISVGDRLARTLESDKLSYVPRPPQNPKIRGRVIAASDSSVSEIGPQVVVALNRGTREGIEVGNVLALYRDRPNVTDPDAPGSRETVRLPPERYGIVFVFRVFEKVSYALVMNTTRPVNINDVVQAP